MGHSEEKTIFWRYFFIFMVRQFCSIAHRESDSSVDISHNPVIWYGKKTDKEGTMRRSLVIILFLTAMITGAPIISHAADELFDTKTAAGHLEKGIAHLKAKQYDAAIVELEESASIYPEAEAFYYLGYAYYMKGRKRDEESRKKAMENFEQAYEIDPNFTPTRYKPAEPFPPKPEQKNIETRQTPTSDASPQQTPETPQPAQPAAPVPQQQTYEPGTPSRPAPTFKATDRVRNIGNNPAAVN
jgi:tetratricopeptide (TPR) repeat protein